MSSEGFRWERASPGSRELLGVGEGASIAEIKKAYRKLAVRYHPDMSDHPDAEDLFRRIGVAFQELADDCESLGANLGVLTTDELRYALRGVEGGVPQGSTDDELRKRVAALWGLPLYMGQGRGRGVPSFVGSFDAEPDVARETRLREERDEAARRGQQPLPVFGDAGLCAPLDGNDHLIESILRSQEAVRKGQQPVPGPAMGDWFKRSQQSVGPSSFVAGGFGRCGPPFDASGGGLSGQVPSATDGPTRGTTTAAASTAEGLHRTGSAVERQRREAAERVTAACEEETREMDAQLAEAERQIVALGGGQSTFRSVEWPAPGKNPN